MGLISNSTPVWSDPSGTLIVRQVAMSELAALVTVCRPDGAREATQEKCTDYWDNDCDGLAGELGRNPFLGENRRKARVRGTPGS